MRRAVNSAVRLSSTSDTQQVEDMLRQKLAIEPTEVISNDGTFVLTRQEGQQVKKPLKPPRSGNKKTPK